MATLSILASSATATPPIPSDGEFYDHAAVLRCQSATEEYFGWEEVKWDTAGALAFYNEYRNLQMVTVKGEHVDGTVWADCAINHETDRIFVYDFAPGPYPHEIDPDEEL